MLPIIAINREKCVGCAYCAMVCPVNSFRVEGFSQFLKECIKCKKCIMNCPVCAIEALWEEV